MQILSEVAESSPPDFWSYSDRELIRACGHIAEGRVTAADRRLRDEALRLFLVWHDAMGAGALEFEEPHDRAALLAGLRKRTIQVLVGLSCRRGRLIPGR